ncbi:hypothetical protein PEL8287_02199 [Roseovarius litorisediminis]|uniref:Uncharacterized protein n=1 Tax=Roseovarius litorisediminis TaxID=1312363 RepID=A0A1Y5SRQ2_9RHOB|nr:hypothetical protein [Roseovarius litorisediminis]SLN43717.1 hypothetical protein PEL8287_02199 [Roseovarius litorisediminis]
MTRNIAQTKLTELDLMIIRAGGRTQAEFETMVKSGFGFEARCKSCAVLADIAYRLFVKLEAGANRGREASHLRLAARNGFDSL